MEALADVDLVCNFYNLIMLSHRLHGQVVRASELQLGGPGFDSWLGHTEDLRNGTYCHCAWCSISMKTFEYGKQASDSQLVKRLCTALIEPKWLKNEP